MATRHLWRITKEHFRQLRNGARDLEVRVGYPLIKWVQEGDSIVFENYGTNEFIVERITVYDSFERMLKVEGAERVCPGMTFTGALKSLQNIYPPEKEALGVYVFQLARRLSHAQLNLKFCKISDWLKAGKNKEFARRVAEIYMVTDWLSEYYPDHCDHYFSKYVPGIFDGTREIIICYIDSEIAAVAILKKDSHERKISTIYLKPKYQPSNISNVLLSRLLERSFAWLETTQPLMTIADDMLDQFANYIKKYNWVETQILPDGYYNNHSREHVFNG